MNQFCPYASAFSGRKVAAHFSISFYVTSIAVYPFMSTVSLSLSLSTGNTNRRHTKANKVPCKALLQLFGRQRFRFTH